MSTNFGQPNLFYVQCHKCGRLAEPCRFPFRKLCRSCLAWAIEDAQDIQHRLEAFGRTYGYAQGMVLEFGKWILGAIEIPPAPPGQQEVDEDAEWEDISY